MKVLIFFFNAARFFPIEERDAARSGNVQAGTVVDTNVTDPRQFDYFMVSQDGIQVSISAGCILNSTLYVCLAIF